MATGRATTEQLTDEQIVGRVRRGEVRMFGELVRRYQDPVYAMALRFVGSPVDAEDVAQEVFLRVHRGMEGFKGDSRFSTWLYRITWNVCADWLRRNRKPGRIPAPIQTDEALPDGRVDLEEDVLAQEERVRVRTAIAGLDEIYRSVVILLYYQKLSYEQIAEVLGVPVKTVETRLYRARKLLREGLERAGGGS